jgi:hypothetical protein
VHKANESMIHLVRARLHMKPTGPRPMEMKMDPPSVRADRFEYITCCFQLG